MVVVKVFEELQPAIALIRWHDRVNPHVERGRENLQFGFGEWGTVRALEATPRPLS